MKRRKTLIKVLRSRTRRRTLTKMLRSRTKRRKTPTRMLKSRTRIRTLIKMLKSRTRRKMNLGKKQTRGRERMLMTLRVTKMDKNRMKKRTRKQTTPKMKEAGLNPQRVVILGPQAQGTELRVSPRGRRHSHRCVAAYLGQEGDKFLTDHKIWRLK
jgi:hypothetical protein